MEPPTQVAQGGTLVPGQAEGGKTGEHSAAVDIAFGATEGILIGTADKAIERGIAGSGSKAFGRASGLAVVVEAFHTAYNINKTIRDPDPRLSAGEKASLVSLQVAGGASTLVVAAGGAAAGTVLTGGSPAGAVIGGGLAGAAFADRASRVIHEQTEIYRWNQFK